MNFVFATLENLKYNHLFGFSKHTKNKAYVPSEQLHKLRIFIGYQKKI